MQSTVTARFSSVDEADRAVGRLRHMIPHLQAELSSPGYGQDPVQSPFSVSVYYPWRINMTFNDQGPRNTEFGSRAILTSDLMGLPMYSDGETELFVVEAALLIEGGYQSLVDELWYVYASEEARIRRLMENRGYSREKSLQILSRQLSEDVFRKECDFVIDNSGPLEEAFEQVRAKLEAYSWRE